MSNSESPAIVSATSVATDLTTILSHMLKHGSTPMVEFAERYELSFTQLKTVFILVNAAEPMPIGHIAEVSGGSLPATGRAVDGLVGHGLVDRKEDPADRRVKLVQITPLGERAVETIYAGRQEILEGLLGVLDEDELTELAGAMAPLVAAATADLNTGEEGR